ncbi:MAG TPA: HD family hydrolase [Blastocatellia bacterium]
MHLPEAGGLISFLAELMRLKSTPRIGWLLRGVRDVESVAAHSFGVAVIAMLLADRARARGVEVNVERLLRMALLHDLTETRTGDLPSTIKRYFGKASIKAADEAIAIDIFAQLGDFRESYLELWSDYEHRASVESKLVKAADKLDLLVQSREYEKGGARSLQEFWDTADSDFAGLGVDDLISDLIEELKKGRKKDLGG